MQHLTFFRWNVPSDGFRWLETRGGEIASWAGDWKVSTYLTTGQPAGIQFAARQYQPLADYPALFREFADLDPSPDPILRFANRFGWLGVLEFIELPGSSKLGPGERLSLWQDEIRAMRGDIAIWDALQNRDAEALEHHIELLGEGKSAVWVDGQDAGQVGGFHTLFDVQHNLRPEFTAFQDPVRQAKLKLLLDVNARLEKHCAPRMVYFEEIDDLSAVLAPKDLLGALWLQLAMAVSEKTPFRRCPAPGCGKWFVVKPDRARSDKLFCSGACRARWFRDRKAKAHRMYEEGTPVEEIARRLQTEPGTIARWLEVGR